MTPTNAVTRAIIDYFHVLGGMAWRNNTGAMRKPYTDKGGATREHFIPFGEKGSGDVLALLRGVFYSIEVKTGKDKLRPTQDQWIARVIANGGVAFVAHDLDDVIERVSQ